MAKAAALTVTLLTLSTFGAFGTKTAEAHMLVRHHNETNLHWANRIIQHGQTGIKWIKHHPRAYKFRGLYEQALHNHRWLLRYGKELKVEYTPKPKRAIYTDNIPPHYTDWLCIHHYEGAWNDSGAPYYGGLQMDWSFMSTYGGSLLRAKGTADHWTPLEQMWVAENGLRVQGWGAWPNTARMCGLL